jgi:hypothetical protein
MRLCRRRVSLKEDSRGGAQNGRVAGASDGVCKNGTAGGLEQRRQALGLFEFRFAARWHAL